MDEAQVSPLALDTMSLHQDRLVMAVGMGQAHVSTLVRDTGSGLAESPALDTRSLYQDSLLVANMVWFRSILGLCHAGFKLWSVLCF